MDFDIIIDNNFGGKKKMNSEKKTELVNIITKFADSGWDLIDAPAKAWLQKRFESDHAIVQNLVEATEKANLECGNCGCEYDPLYKIVLHSKDVLFAQKKELSIKNLLDTSKEQMPNEEYTINAQMLIRKPVSEVFRAFVEPEITTNFWFTKSTGKLEQGKTIIWHWEMYNASAEIKVKEIVENKLIKLDWGGPMPEVEFEFTVFGENATYVHIKNYGCKYSGKELIDTLTGQLGGFTTVLDGLKAYLEYNIKLNLIGDKFPDKIIK